MIIDSTIEPDKEEDILSRLTSEENLSNLIVVEDGRTKHSGNKKGGTRIPKEIRELIAATAIENGVEAAAAEWGVSISTASNYANGLLSNGTERVLDPNLAKNADEIKAEQRKQREEAIDEKELNLHEAAIDSMLGAVKVVDRFLMPDNPAAPIDLRSADRAASIVSKLSRIPALRSKKDDGGTGIKTLIINAPAMQSIDKYDVIDVTPKQKSA